MPTLVSINTAKEQAQTYQPLLLASFVFADGRVLYLSTHAVTYASNAYLPRIIDMKLGPVAQDGQGISVPSTATLKCADADEWLYTNYEAYYSGQTNGFKGAVLTLTFVYYDIVSGEFSPDSIVKFIGRCGSPQIDDKTLTIPALNKYNLAPYNLPSLQIQALCPWIFPATAALQEAAANGSNQQSKECPYNPTGSTNPRGNLNSGVIYTSCPKTKAGCQARGMYSTDSSSRQTGTFGGVQFNPPTSSISRSYETSKYQQVINNGPEARYGDVVPLMYGEGWVSPCKVLNTWPDANYQRMEVLVTYGKVGDIFKVLVNNVEIPHIFGDPIGSVPPDVLTTKDALRIGWWQFVNDGSVYSAPGSAYNGQGDPYGSLCVLYIQVVVDIAAANSVPNVQVLLQGQQIRVYSNPTTYSQQFSSDPWWIAMDLLTWANLEYSDLDIAGFITQAAFADALIPYTSQYGVSSVHARFAYSLCLTQASTADQTMRAALNGVRGILVPNYAGGYLSPRTMMTLADQQPAPVDGSNYSTAIPSFTTQSTPSGASANGYAAYYFHEGTIAEDSNGETTLRISQAQIQQAPNRMGFVFQDSENTFNADSISITDDEDVAISGQVISGSVQVNGPNTYDHGQRIVATKLAEGYRGNGRLALDGETIGDTRGTITATFETSHRVVKLYLGDLVVIDSQKYGWSLANYIAGTQEAPFFRIQKIEPNANYERVTVTAAFHNDGWYLDTFGQTGAKLWTSGWRSPNLLGPRALIASADPFLSDTADPVFANATANCYPEMALQPVQYSSVGGVSSARLVVKFAVPVNSVDGTAQPPYVPVQSLNANTGGALPGGYTYYLALVAATSNGQTAASLLTKTYVAAGTSTNTLTIPNLYWDANTSGYLLYAGIAPDQLYLQTGNYTHTGSNAAQPASITITGKLTQAGQLPDTQMAKVRLKTKLEYIPGVIVDIVSSAALSGGSWTLGLEKIALSAGTPLATNALVGREVALLGRFSASEPDIFPTALTITASTSSTITVNADLLGEAAFVAGDQIAIRISATIGSDGGGNYIQDALFVNPINGSGLLAQSLYGWLYAGLANYTSLEWLLLRIIRGTGAGTTVSIASNTATKIYIAGAWPVTPDSTSVFVVEHNAWETQSDTSKLSNNGSMGVMSSTIDVSSWRGACVLVQAVTLAADGTESTDSNAPVREAYLLGAGAGSDSDVPPAPGFTLTTDSEGNFILQEVGFTSATNISTVESGTFTTFTWNMAKASTGADAALAAAMTLSGTALTVVSALSTYAGQVLAIDEELVGVLSFSGTAITVARGVLGSAAATHASGAGVFALDETINTLSFPPLLFTEAYAANWQQALPYPNRLLLAAELFVTNQIGNSPATQICYTGLSPFGVAGIPTAGYMAGVQGLADTFAIAGTLAIGSNLATPYQRDIVTQPRHIVAYVTQPPTGSGITIHINVNGALYYSLTIPAANNDAIGTPPFAALPLGPITIDIIAVGSSFPGADLGVTIFG